MNEWHKVTEYLCNTCQMSSFWLHVGNVTWKVLHILHGWPKDHDSWCIHTRWSHGVFYTYSIYLTNEKSGGKSEEIDTMNEKQMQINENLEISLCIKKKVNNTPPILKEQYSKNKTHPNSPPLPTALQIIHSLFTFDFEVHGYCFYRTHCSKQCHKHLFSHSWSGSLDFFQDEPCVNK